MIESAVIALDEMLATLRAHMECGANSYANRELYRELMGFAEAARAENAALRARLELADKLAEATDTSHAIFAILSTWAAGFIFGWLLRGIW